MKEKNKFVSKPCSKGNSWEGTKDRCRNKLRHYRMLSLCSWRIWGKKPGRLCLPVISQKYLTMEHFFSNRYIHVWNTLFQYVVFEHMMKLIGLSTDFLFIKKKRISWQAYEYHMFTALKQKINYSIFRSFSTFLQSYICYIN